MNDFSNTNPPGTPQPGPRPTTPSGDGHAGAADLFGEAPATPALEPPPQQPRRGLGALRGAGKPKRGKTQPSFPHGAQPAMAGVPNGGAAVAPRSRRMQLPSGSRSSGGSPAMRLAMWVLSALIVLGAVGVFSGVVDFTDGATQIGASSGGKSASGGSDNWSYYHDQKFDTSDTGPKWTSDRTRSTDPNEAVLGDTSRWEYDGPYEYGPYGSHGIEGRQRGGSAAGDPLYTDPTQLESVFTKYGDPDPSGGAPVGVAPSSLTNPYYDPYAGYSNPYANQIRLSYGEGYGRGAAMP